MPTRRVVRVARVVLHRPPRDDGAPGGALVRARRRLADGRERAASGLLEVEVNAGEPAINSAERRQLLRRLRVLELDLRRAALEARNAPL